MIKAVYPGSFDPVTLGHLDIIRRAAKVVDELIIGVLVNSAKTSFFTLEERVEMIEQVTKDLPNVRVKKFEGMTVNFARENEAHLIIRGLRAVTDFEYEMQIAQTNHMIAPDIDTMFFTTSLEYAFLSSTIVKEVAYYGEDITKFVMPEVIDAFNKKHEVLGLKKLEKLG
ncbi:MAG: pantetheine-phosphate adenylyltransferase [Clostridiales bacterium]|nr:pantetheine-phosphate adenylyltransferase [Clostridiales bacterium]